MMERVENNYTSTWWVFTLWKLTQFHHLFSRLTTALEAFVFDDVIIRSCTCVKHFKSSKIVSSNLRCRFIFSCSLLLSLPLSRTPTTLFLSISLSLPLLIETFHSIHSLTSPTLYLLVHSPFSRPPNNKYPTLTSSHLCSPHPSQNPRKKKKNSNYSYSSSSYVASRRARNRNRNGMIRLHPSPPACLISERV